VAKRGYKGHLMGRLSRSGCFLLTSTAIQGSSWSRSCYLATNVLQ